MTDQNDWTRKPTQEKAEEEKKKEDEVHFKQLAEETTLHGIGKIFNSEYSIIRK